MYVHTKVLYPVLWWQQQFRYPLLVSLITILCRRPPAWPDAWAAGDDELEGLRQPRPGAGGGGRLPSGWVIIIHYYFSLLLFIIIIHYYYLLLLFWVSGSWHVMDVHAWYKLITILPIMTKGLSALTIIWMDRRSQIRRPFERAKTKALELSPLRSAQVKERNISYFRNVSAFIHRHIQRRKVRSK